jgi:hypothetical protein
MPKIYTRAHCRWPHAASDSTITNGPKPGGQLTQGWEHINLAGKYRWPIQMANSLAQDSTVFRKRSIEYTYTFILIHQKIGDHKTVT